MLRGKDPDALFLTFLARFFYSVSVLCSRLSKASSGL